MKTIHTKQGRIDSQNIQFESLITQSYTQTTYKGLQIFTKADNNSFWLKIFRDNSSNHICYSRYRTEAQMLENVERYKSGYDRNEAYRAENKANKTKSTAANCSTAIKAELSTLFPLVKFSVKSSNFSGGNSVRIEWVDGPTTETVENTTSKYQYGSFNGMEDIYEYSNSREDIPQAKYVQETREMSAEFSALLPALTEMLGDYEQNYRDSPEQILRRIFSKTSITGKIAGIERTNITCGQHEDFYRVTFENEPQQETKEPAQFEKVEVIAGEIQIVDYSEKAFAVIGDTKSIKDKLKSLGGKFNFRLSCGPGWIFSKKQLEKVTIELSGENETKPDTLKGEINKTLDWFAESDIKNCGHITESTKEVFKMQGRELPPKKYDNLTDIENAANNGEVISLCNLFELVQKKQA